MIDDPLNKPDDVDTVVTDVEMQPGKPEVVVRVRFHPNTADILLNADDDTTAPRLRIIVGALLVQGGVNDLPSHLRPSIRPTVRALQRFVHVIFRVAVRKRVSEPRSDLDDP